MADDGIVIEGRFTNNRLINNHADVGGTAFRATKSAFLDGNEFGGNTFISRGRLTKDQLSGVRERLHVPDEVSPHDLVQALRELAQAPQRARPSLFAKFRSFFGVAADMKDVHEVIESIRELL